MCGLLKRKFKKKILDKKQIEVAEGITGVILANEAVKNWELKVKDYVKNPVDTNKKRVKQIQEIACAHQVDDYLASILYVSKA